MIFSQYILQKLARQILKDYLQINDSSNWQHFTVPAGELGNFLADPQSYTFELTPGMKLNTSAPTAANMQNSHWNRVVISLLAAKASERASERAEYYGCDTREIEWMRLLKDRVYRILLEVVKAKAGNRDPIYETRKQASRKRRCRQYVCISNIYISRSILH